MTTELTSVTVPPRKAENSGRRTAFAAERGPSLGREEPDGASIRCRLDDNKKPVETSGSKYQEIRAGLWPCSFFASAREVEASQMPTPTATNPATKFQPSGSLTIS